MIEIYSLVVLVISAIMFVLYKLLKLRTSKITVHLENSIENATKVSHQAAFSLAFKVSGIASRNLSTKSDISCSEIVKNSLA